MKNFFRIAGITVAALALIIIAVKAEEFSDMRKMRQELRSELQQYKQKEIIPNLNEWKNKLDNSMTAEDLAKLNDLRAKASEIKQNMAKKRAEIREEMMNEEGRNRKDVRKKMRGIGKQTKSEMKDIIAELKPIAEKYSETLKSISEVASEKSEKWQEDMEQIIDEWHEKYDVELEKLAEKNRKGGPKGKFMHGKHRQEMNFDGKKAIGRFMLWNGDESSLFDDEPGTIMGVNSAELQKELSVTPNPFSYKTNINFTVPSTQKVQITVVDQMGNTVATLVDGKLEEGKHTVEFNLNSVTAELPNGTYLYKIEGETFQNTGKMLLSK